MPYLRIETNVRLEGERRTSFLETASARTAELLGKDERWVMVRLDDGSPMVHGGSPEPTAFVTLASIGLPEERCPELSAALCELLTEALDVPAARTYIDFRPLERSWFGFDGGTL